MATVAELKNRIKLLEKELAAAQRGDPGADDPTRRYHPGLEVRKNYEWQRLPEIHEGTGVKKKREMERLPEMHEGTRVGKKTPPTKTTRGRGGTRQRRYTAEKMHEDYWEKIFKHFENPTRSHYTFRSPAKGSDSGIKMPVERAKQFVRRLREAQLESGKDVGEYANELNEEANRLVQQTKLWKSRMKAKPKQSGSQESWKDHSLTGAEHNELMSRLRRHGKNRGSMPEDYDRAMDKMVKQLKENKLPGWDAEGKRTDLGTPVHPVSNTPAWTHPQMNPVALTPTSQPTFTSQPTTTSQTTTTRQQKPVETLSSSPAKTTLAERAERFVLDGNGAAPVSVGAPATEKKTGGQLTELELAMRHPSTSPYGDIRGLTLEELRMLGLV